MTGRVTDPGALSEEERSALRKQLRRLLSDVEEGEDTGLLSLQVEGEDGWTISLPGAAAGTVLDLLSNLAEGRAVSVSDAGEELTTREAAELLSVSRPHLTQLLKEDEIPSGPTTASTAGTCWPTRPGARNSRRRQCRSSLGSAKSLDSMTESASLRVGARLSEVIQ
jgi:DNA-binding transcriptional ArsR family regulator